MSPTTVIGFVQDNGQSLYNVAYYFGMGVVGIFMLLPTAHDGGTIPGRIVNVLQTVASFFKLNTPTDKTV